MFFFDFKLQPRIRNGTEPLKTLDNNGVKPYIRDHCIAVCAWARDDEPIKSFVVRNESQLATLAKSLDFLEDVKVETVACAHNAQFVAEVWDADCMSLGSRPKNLVCLMTLARLMLLPTELHALASLALDDDKKLHRSESIEKTTDGHNLSDDELDALKSYCEDDVDLCRKLWSKLQSTWVKSCGDDSTREVWLQFAADMVVNRNGVPIDTETVSQAARRVEMLEHQANQIVSQLSAKQITSATQTKTGLDWVLTQLPSTIPVPARRGRVDIDSVKRIAEANNPKLVPFLEALESCSWIAAGKWKKALDRAYKGRIHNSYTFAGTITGRWKSHGLQLHNFPSRIKTETILDWRNASMKQLSGQARSMVTAPEGRTLVIADYNQIELRILMTLSCRHDMLNKIHVGFDLYKQIARKIFGCDTPSENQRNIAKRAVLALGYGIGQDKLYRDLRSAFGPVTREESEQIHNTYHTLFPEMKEVWDNYEIAWKSALHEKKAKLFGLTLSKHPDVNAVVVQLPSGRPLWYWMLRDVKGWLEYVKPNGSFCSTWGAKLVVNACQAISRDILADAIKRMCLPGILPNGAQVVGHVHDEIIVECPEETAGDTKQAVETAMEMQTRTCQRIGLLLKVKTQIRKTWYTKS